MTDPVERKALTREHLLNVYRTMRTIREFEERVHAEFSTGEIPGFVHLYAGEEASAVGVCSNLDDRDTIASTHRGHGHCIARGVDVSEMMAEIYGRRTGSCHGKGGSMHIADLSKGMLGADGIDFFAVHEAASEAIARARDGGGPTLIEMKFTRYFGHFEGDQQTYRAGEVEHARAELDCLKRFADRVTETGELARADLDGVDAEVATLIDKAVDEAKAAPLPTEADLLTDVYVRY